MQGIIFDAPCKAILRTLSQKDQVQLGDFLSHIDVQKISDEDRMNRDHKVFYRLKWKRFRIYVESHEDKTLRVHSMIPKHSWDDFLFRTKLPYSPEPGAPKESI